MATINDIAKVAGVSSGTVSRILNHDDTLSTTIETKLKIISIAEELEYVPLNERKKRKKSTTPRFNVAIVEWYDSLTLAEDPYYLHLMTTIVKYLTKNNINSYKLVLMDEGYVSTVDTIPDCIIAIGRFNEIQVNQLAKINEKIIFIDSCPDATRFDSILVNTQLGTKQALDYLISLGHTDIAFIGGRVITEIGMEFKDDTTDKRATTFVEYLKTKNLFNEEYFFIGEKLSYAVGINLCTQMLSLNKLPTAILCANDTMATAVISRLSNNGYRIPEDISVVGFNNISNAKYLTPPLTTVKIPLFAIAQTCLDLLQSHKNRDVFYPRLTYIPTSIKIRESVKDVTELK